jgi:hypothetical protein
MEVPQVGNSYRVSLVLPNQGVRGFLAILNAESFKDLMASICHPYQFSGIHLHTIMVGLGE